MSNYCGVCGKECSSHWEDDGIGPYEFWGQKGNQSVTVLVSDCCDGDVYENEELTVDAESASSDFDTRADYLYDQQRDERATA